MHFRQITMVVTGAALLLACTTEVAKRKKSTPVDPGDDFFIDEDPTEEAPIGTNVVDDSGAFGAPERPKKDAGSIDDAGPLLDAGSDSGTTKAYCTGPIAAGDLIVNEIMITSRAGSGDDGEWVEIKNARTCWLKLPGVTVESPRGAQSNVATLDGELGPGATLVVADSVDPAKNHGIPGLVKAWEATDVLKNDGDTISIKSGAVVVDSLTYPSFNNLVPGRTLSFPSDCPATARSDWQRWSLSFHAYSGTFQGTPNADNGDVACF